VAKAIFDTLGGEVTTGLNTWSLLAMMVGIVAGRLSIMYGGAWAWGTLMYTLSSLLRRNMLEWLVAGPGTRTLPDSPGEAISRFRDDVDEVVEYIEGWTDFGGFFLFAVIALIIMFNVDPVITVVMLVPLVGIGVVAHRMGGTIRKYRKATREATGRITAFIGEIFGSVQALKIASAEPHVIDHFRTLNEERKGVALKDNLLSELLRSLNANMVNIGTGIILLLVASSMNRGEFSVGDFALFIFYLQRLTISMFFLGDMLAQHRRAGVSFERMGELMRGAPKETLVAHNPLYMGDTIPDR
jgi:ABC-type multidrug transport system fused ATPase/permease subunit